MKPDRKARLYAQSLVNVARDAGTITAVGDSLDQLVRLLHQEPALRAFAATRRIPADRKAEALRIILDGQIQPTVIEFLLIVVEKNILPLLSNINRVFKLLADRETGQVDMTIFSARPLDQAAVTEIVRNIEAKSGKSIRPTVAEDPSLIAGVKLRIGNVFLDGSLQNRLNRLKESLLIQ